MALVLTGTLGKDRLLAMLGSDLVWLLLAAFILAAVIKDAGLAGRMVAALLTRPFTSRKTKGVFRAVDLELILYMAATMLIAQTMTETGADRWLADQAMAALSAAMLVSGPGLR